jgi:predicted RNase H-like HicB family nuclease
LKLKVLIYVAEEGGYWAKVPAIPGCVSQGETLDEVKANILDALEGCLAVREEMAAGEAPALEEIEVGRPYPASTFARFSRNTDGFASAPPKAATSSLPSQAIRPRFRSPFMGIKISRRDSKPT